jgi:hypothetical protein
MNKLILACLVGLLATGCSTTAPVAVKFPEAPASLITPAGKLTPLTKEKPELSDIIENANENAGKYYELRERFRAWQEWYSTQKKIFESVK